MVGPVAVGPNAMSALTVVPGGGSGGAGGGEVSAAIAAAMAHFPRSLLNGARSPLIAAVSVVPVPETHFHHDRLGEVGRVGHQLRVEVLSLAVQERTDAGGRQSGRPHRLQYRITASAPGHTTFATSDTRRGRRT